MNNIERKQIIIREQLISYLIGGQEHEHKPVLVFLHGWGSEASVWNNVLRSCIESNYRVVAIDLPNFGRSDRSKGAMSFDDYVESLEEMLIKLDIQKYVLIGHSFGGQMSLRFAQRKPTGLKKLVLVGASGVRLPSKKTKFILALAPVVRPIFRLPLMKSIRAKAYDRMGSNYLFRPDLQKTFDNVVTQTDLTDELKNITYPSLLMWGDKDTATPMNQARTMQTLLPDARLVVFPGIGHYSFLDEPERFIKELLSFIEE
jgi:pimeloyl-ACP methyl ester carboxylesterase